VEDSPRTSTFFAGIERDDDTESKIADHRSCGGASGEDERELESIATRLSSDHKQVDASQRL
jgi:hypothetical protein